MAGMWADISDLESPTAPNAADALAASSYLLWVLTGRKWSGVKTVTEEYVCVNGRSCAAGWFMSGRDWDYGRTRMAVAAGDPFWGHQEGQRFLFLRHRPARELVEVRRCHTGEELDLSTLAIYDYAFVAPSCAGACDPCFDPCGLEVTYRWGSVPPAAGRLAAIDLANELVKSIECPDECRLPERVTSVNRQGLSYQVFDPQDYLDDGRVGLYSCDSFIKAVNPNKAQAQAKVFSVDMPSGRRKTGTIPRPTPHPSAARHVEPERVVVPSFSHVVTVPETGVGWFPVNHDLGSRRVDVAAYDAGGLRVDVEALSVNDRRVDVTLADVNPGDYTIVVLGKPS